MDGKLTALKITALLKARKPGLFNDGGGLYLQIRRNGGRSWIFRYTNGSRTRDMGLGALDTISLAEARDLARKQRRLRYDGLDPIEHRKASRVKTQTEAAKLMSFKECAEAVRDLRKSGWRTEETAVKFITRLETHAYPVFDRGNLPARDINTPLVVKVLSRIWLTKPIMAKEIRWMLEAVLSWATSVGCREGDNPARWKGHLENLLPAQRQSIRHHAALPYAELPAFMADMRKLEGVVPRAFRIHGLGRRTEDEVIHWCALG